MMLKDLNLYIHIPFCKSRCAYCHFYSQLDLNLIDSYLEALQADFLLRDAVADIKNRYLLKTIYFGGGSPSLLSPKQVEEILVFLKSKANFAQNIEITLEINPKDVNIGVWEEFSRVGVNRFSFGVQTLNRKIRGLIGREGDLDKIKKLLQEAKKRGFSFGVDFMYGLPEEKLSDIKASLGFVKGLKPNHVSFYELMQDKSTPLYYKKVRYPKEKTIVSRYDFICRELEKIGYEHYEFANWARSGNYCRHNLDFWQNKNYLGLGASAVSFLDNFSWTNILSIQDYISSVKNSSQYFTEEKHNKKDLIRKFIILGLRTTRGIDLADFEVLFGEKESQLLQERALANKYLSVNNKRIAVKDEKSWLWMEEIIRYAMNGIGA